MATVRHLQFERCSCKWEEAVPQQINQLCIGRDCRTAHRDLQLPTAGLSEQPVRREQRLHMDALESSRLCTMSNICMLPNCKHMVCRPVAFQSSGLAKGSSDKPAPAAEVKMEIKQEAPLGPTAGLGATAGLGVTAGLGSTAGLGTTAGLGAGGTAGGDQEALPRVPVDGMSHLSYSRASKVNL